MVIEFRLLGPGRQGGFGVGVGCGVAAWASGVEELCHRVCLVSDSDMRGR